jgi:site-specific DNA-methyltransferase (adenine-specific)
MTMSGIFNKSCEHMDEVPAESVALVVTSPPYWNAIDYEQHVADPTEWYRTRRGGTYEEYLGWLRVCFAEVFRKLKPGGFCAVIIGTILNERKQYPLPQHLVAILEELGYEFHEDIVWSKVTGGVKRAGVTIQHPFPGYYCPNIMTENILVLRKPGPRIYTEQTEDGKVRSRYDINSIFTREIANNIWHIAPVPPHYLPHPCPFPEEVPYRLIMLYSYIGDAVLDPFNGIGTTTKVAHAMERNYYGYELQAKYVEVALQRLDEPLRLRDQLIPVYEKIPVTDSPYQRSLENHKRKKGQMTLFATRDAREEYATEAPERCDYVTLKKQAGWLRHKKQLMVISPDLDGVLSALLLQHLWKWELVGFYDASTLWLLKEYSNLDATKPTFVDHDICRKHLPSIGHHMLKWGQDTPIPECEGPDAQSFNPNLIRGFTLKEFGRKYPFGTVHLLLACYSAWGDLKDYRPSRDFIPLLLQVDSSLQSAFTYEKNALDWMEWLGGSDDARSPIYPLCKALAAASSKRLLRWQAQLGDQIQALGFTRHSQCKTDNPTDEEQWQRLLKLLAWLEELTGWTADFPDFTDAKVVRTDIKRASCKPTKTNFVKVIAEKPFSYALISKTEQGLNYGHLP